MCSLMLRGCPWGSKYGLRVDGVSMEFSPAPEGVKASTHTFHTLFEKAYESSWETMVTLRTPRTSAAKETSLLTSSSFTQSWTPHRDNMRYVTRISSVMETTWKPGPETCPLWSLETDHFTCHFQATPISTHYWPLSLLNSPINISLQGSYNVLLTILVNGAGNSFPLPIHIFSPAPPNYLMD